MFLFRTLLLSLTLCIASPAAVPFATPSSKEGIAGHNIDLLLDARYKVFEENLTFGLQKFGYYWRNAENGPIASESPMNCPGGFTLFPRSPSEKERLDIHRYHCYNTAFLDRFEKRFAITKRYGMQSAAVLWSAPERYTDPGCEGFYFDGQKRHIKEGCFPTPEHYDDYEDWVRFTAARFGDYIDHYVVWNEADLLDWADSTTSRYPRKKMLADLPLHMKRTFDIYTELLKRTITAVESLDSTCSPDGEACRNLVYISMTNIWTDRSEVKETPDGIHIIWGGKNLLHAVWEQVGLDKAWAVAVHPYGNVYRNDDRLHIGTLQPLIDYQKAHIAQKSEKPASSFAQSRLFLSEQNVNKAAWEAKARFICEAHDVMMRTPEIINTAHNYFQESIRPSSIVMPPHAMLPASVKPDLDHADDYPTFRAYASTALQTWGKRDDHFCCEAYALGCRNVEATILELGKELNGIVLPDADGQLHSVTPQTRRIVFAYDNDSGQLLNAFFKTHPEWLMSDAMLYIADLSRAPSFVRSLFILPGLRDLPFPVLIIDNEAKATRYRPEKRDSGAVLVELNRFKIVKITPLNENGIQNLDKLLAKTEHVER